MSGLFMSAFAAAQDADSAAAERERKLLEAVQYDYNVIKADLIRAFVGGIGIVYERRTNLNVSFLGELDWNPTAYRKRFILGAGVRYYYNLEYRILKRWEKGKKTSCLSADYFELDLRCGRKTGEYYEELYIPTGGFFAPVVKIGFQRRLGKRCFFDLWGGYQIPLPDRRPKDDRIMPFGTFTGGFMFGVGI